MSGLTKSGIVFLKFYVTVKENVANSKDVGISKLSINSHIIVGRYLNNLVNLWKQKMSDPTFASRNGGTLRGFLKLKGVHFKFDHVKKLVRLAHLADLFPNIRFIDCVGFDTVLDFSKSFVRFLNDPSNAYDRLFWRETVVKQTVVKQKPVNNNNKQTSLGSVQISGKRRSMRQRKKRAREEETKLAQSFQKKRAKN